jgi:hypothetical protein
VWGKVHHLIQKLEHVLHDVDVYIWKNDNHDGGGNELVDYH